MTPRRWSSTSGTAEAEGGWPIDLRFAHAPDPHEVGLLNGCLIPESWGGWRWTVYAAREVGLARPVAIKVSWTELATREEFQRRLEREARAAAACADDHVVALARGRGLAGCRSIPRFHQFEDRPPFIPFAQLAVAAHAVASSGIGSSEPGR